MLVTNALQYELILAVSNLDVRVVYTIGSPEIGANNFSKRRSDFQAPFLRRNRNRTRKKCAKVHVTLARKMADIFRVRVLAQKKNLKKKYHYNLETKHCETEKTKEILV